MFQLSRRRLILFLLSIDTLTSAFYKLSDAQRVPLPTSWNQAENPRLPEDSGFHLDPGFVDQKSVCILLMLNRQGILSKDRLIVADVHVRLPQPALAFLRKLSQSRPRFLMVTQGAGCPGVEIPVIPAANGAAWIRWDTREPRFLLKP